MPENWLQDTAGCLYQAALGGTGLAAFDMALQSGLAGIGFLDPKAVFVPAIEPGRMVLEVKYDAFLPSFIADALQIGHIRTGAFSKYAVCRKFE